MGQNLNKKEFESILDLIESYKEVTIIESGFNTGNMLSTYIITAGDWPKELLEKIHEQFPQIKDIWEKYPVSQPELSKGQETVPLYLQNAHPHSVDI